ncbi:potassium/proton antiporter [Litoribacter populi]|uniref:potassium/proton antiporter n=1 Tax=Litoribacter populi TaxID=2598460 RepID=UPI00117F8DD5|nr:potassium/proton antiporter [Litoribacter populi]
MNVTIENILLIGSILLIISIVVGKTSYKFGVPTLVLFLFVGILAGSEGLAGIHFSNLKVAQFVGIVALNFILFSGGLDTSWQSIKPVLWQGVTLSTIGVLITAISLGLFVWQVTDFSLYEGLLLGAIVSSTDAAAVFSILRSKSLALKSRIRPTLELESGSNDPMAYVLTIAFLGLVVNPDQSIWTIFPLFLRQMMIGACMGFLFGVSSKYVINKLDIGFDGLYPVLVIGLMLLNFSSTDLFGGNGFLSVYLAAVYLGNQEFIHKKTVLKMFDGLAWLMQIVLFLTLGLLVVPSQIIPLMGIGMIISLFLILIARPVGVFLSLLPFKMKHRRRWYISWVGLRGAVPIVFATYPLIAGIEKASIIFNIVFFISVTSVLLQGTTLSYIAKLFHVALPEKVKQRLPMDLLLSDNPKAEMEKIQITENSSVLGKQIVELNFPRTSLIAMIEHNGKYSIPAGTTKIKAGDVLYVLSENNDSLKKVYDSLNLKNSEKKTSSNED